MKKAIVISCLLLIWISCAKDTPSPTPASTCSSSTFTDGSGNQYATVQIGTQCWLTENLKTTQYRNGDQIPRLDSASLWVSTNQGALCSYNNDTALSDTYGHLYNYIAITDPRGLCPTGTHVASLSDWELLMINTGGDSISGGALKETGVLHWNAPNTGAINSYGFTALPGGNRTYTGIFSGLGSVGKWWTSTDSTSLLGFDFYINNNSAFLTKDYDAKNSGFSIRCVVD